MYLHSCKIRPYWVGKCVLVLCGIAVANSCLKMVQVSCIGQTGHVGRVKTTLVTTLEGAGWQKRTKKQIYYVIYAQKGKGADRAASPGPLEPANTTLLKPIYMWHVTRLSPQQS